MKILCTSDWHLSSQKPLCRSDEDWMETQRERLAEIAGIAIESKADVVIAGDLFDMPRVSEEVLCMYIGFCRTLAEASLRVFLIAGNHDLPFHSYDKMESSSMGVLDAMGWVMHECDESSRKECLREHASWILGPYHYGMKKPWIGDIVVLHAYAVEDESRRPPFSSYETAKSLLEGCKDPALIVVGDNHRPWTSKIGKVNIINCGCILRRSVNELDYVPKVWLWDSDANEVEAVELEDDSSLVDASYIAERHDLDMHERQYDAMLAELKKDMSVRYDYLTTLETYAKENSNRLGPDVTEEILSIITEIKERKE